jgi:hypothetical protein
MTATSVVRMDVSTCGIVSSLIASHRINQRERLVIVRTSLLLSTCDTPPHLFLAAHLNALTFSGDIRQDLLRDTAIPADLIIGMLFSLITTDD